MSAADDMPTRREFEALTIEVRGLRNDLSSQYLRQDVYQAETAERVRRLDDVEKFIDWVRNGLLAFLATAVIGAAIFVLLHQGPA